MNGEWKNCPYCAIEKHEDNPVFVDLEGGPKKPTPATCNRGHKSVWDLVEGKVTWMRPRGEQDA